MFGILVQLLISKSFLVYIATFWKLSSNKSETIGKENSERKQLARSEQNENEKKTEFEVNKLLSLETGNINYAT